MKKLFIILFLCSTCFSQAIRKQTGKSLYDIDFKDPNRFQVTVGDSSSFRPKIQFRFWDEDEIWLEYPGVQVNPVLDNDKLTIDANDIGMDWQKVGKQLKWFIRLKAKPPNGKYKFNLGGNWRDFDFSKQPHPEDVKYYAHNSLTTFQRDGKDWYRWDEIRAGTLLPGWERLVEFTGGYVVYHKTKAFRGNNGKYYGVGKVLDIPRPLASNGIRSEYCELDITNGVYTSTLPKSLIDDGIYPITINDTFGYETVGASTSGSIPTGWVWGNAYDSGAAGNLSILSYAGGQAGTTMQAGLYTTAPALVEDTDEQTSTNGTFVDYTFQTSAGISGSTTYIMCVQGNGSWKFRFDNTSTTGHWDSGTSYSSGTMPASPSWNLTNDTEKLSIHVDYTASGGGVLQPYYYLSGNN